MQSKIKSLRIVFAGTPDISATILKALIDQKYNVVGVFTQPDRVRGRGKKLKILPVKSLALMHDNIPIFQPVSFKNESEAIMQLVNLNADVMVVVGYGLLLPKAVLDIPKQGCINIHFSLLPEWRGAAPIQRGIEAGNSKTGVTIIQMDEGLDTGDILHVSEFPIWSTDNSSSLHDGLAKLAIFSVCEVLIKMANGVALEPKAQPQGATYAYKLTKEEGLIDFKNSCQLIDCKVRAFIPWPNAYVKLDGDLVRIADIQIIDKSVNIIPATILDIDKHGIKVQAQDGVINIGSLQFPGKKMLPVASILNGRNLTSLIGQVI